ncbi:MAG: TIGR03086 family metal-binding protein [Acidimicrobiales bacterium]
MAARTIPEQTGHKMTGYGVQDSPMNPTDSLPASANAGDPVLADDPVLASDSAQTTPVIESSDPRHRFARAVMTTATVVAGVRTDQHDQPTPCGEFDAKATMGHLLDVMDTVSRVGRGEAPFDPSRQFTPPPPADWAGAWAKAAHQVRLAWTDPAALEQTVVLPWVTESGSDFLDEYVAELSVHTWDLARATGQNPDWDEEVLAVAFAGIQRLLPPDGRAEMFAQIMAEMLANNPNFPEEWKDSGVPFADRVIVGADAPLIDQLVGWTGRNPWWPSA